MEAEITVGSDGVWSALDRIKKAVIRDFEGAQVAFIRPHGTGFVILKGAPEDARFVRRAQVWGGTAQDDDSWIFPEEKVGDVAAVLHHAFGIKTMHRPPFTSHFIPVEVPSAGTRRAYCL